MGYLRGSGTQTIKGTILLAVEEDGKRSGNSKPKENDVGLELKHDPSLSKESSKTPCLPTTYIARRKMLLVNGDPLDHWKKDNFDSTRDATCRVVFEPKIGKKFFQNTLKPEDYQIMRSLNTSLEQPYFSKYNRFFPKKGHFCCKACGNPIYSSETKFDVDDGWPAFGACVLGSIGVIPVEERISQIENEERACTTIQAVFRGYSCRNRVEAMLDELIEELLRRKHGYTRSDGEEQDDSSSSESYMSLDNSWISDETENSKRSRGSDGGYILSRSLGDDYAEIHCHRCKSHLGDIFAQENTGNNGETYRERHRVNGRALKYMEDDLPKRTMTNASLLFADASQRRRFGLPECKETGEPILPFGKLHWMNASRESSVSLSASNHERSSKIEILRTPFDRLSVSCHPSPYKRYENHSKHESRMIEKKTNDFSIGNGNPKRNTISRRRPMRRGSTDTTTSIADRKLYLENELVWVPEQ